MQEVSWKSPRLNKGQHMVKEIDVGAMSVHHIDRTIDPYLAAVVFRGVVVYTGLHATLADARKTVEEKFKSFQKPT